MAKGVCGADENNCLFRGRDGPRLGTAHLHVAMRIIDWEKLHLQTRVQLPRYDRIAYHIVGDQEPIGLDVPRLLRSPLLHIYVAVSSEKRAAVAG